MPAKGKQIAEKTPPSRKRRNDEDDKSGKRKRRNPGVLQFFDVAADEHDDPDESADDDVDLDFMDNDNSGKKEKSGPGKSHDIPFMPKEELLSDGELELLVEERYRPGSKYVVYADDEKKVKVSSGKESLTKVSGKESLTKVIGDPIIWRVKCTVGRERRTAFCLIQKFVDLKSLGNKLKIASAFAPDHIKGYIYVEAEKEIDIIEACKGISNVYSSRISPVPKNEVGHLFSVRNTSIDIPVGTWVRVKLGRYKGDLAQVVAFDDTRKSVTIKLIPRVDLEALAKKLAGEAKVRQTAIPAARVISSRDLEVVRPHVVVKPDRQTGEFFETIDGLMLKDGYLFKKASIDSISYVDVVPTADELLKFRPYKKDASNDAEWLSHLYGEQKKKRLSDGGKGTNRSMEGTSGTKKGKEFQLHDLVFYGPKDFGVIIGVESDSFQIVKYDEVEGAEAVNVESHEIMNSSIDKKFSTMDQRMKVISINDTVRILEGPFMGREGVVKHICKGIIFIYDKNQLENGGYFCAKPKCCENISSTDTRNGDISDPFGTGDQFGSTTFEDSTSCPKSPEPSRKPWQEKENNQGDRDGGFSVGQTLRIRVGPLKGHLCRIVSMYRSGVNVKVDSQTKVLSVKREHLSEAGVKSSTKRQDGFATQGEPSGAQSESNGWDSLPLTTGRSSWSDLSTPSFLLDSSLKNPFDSLATADGSQKGDDPWGSKDTSKKPTDSWGNVANSSGDHGNGDDPWASKEASKQPTDSWGTAVHSGGEIGKGDDPWGSKETFKQPTNSWGNAAGVSGDNEKGDDPWGSKETSKQPTNSWGNATSASGDLEKRDDPWGSKETSKQPTNSWGNAVSSSGDLEKGNNPWGNNETSNKPTDNWGNAESAGGNLGKGDDPWGSKETSKPTESWGNAVISSGDDGKGDDHWVSKEASKKPADSWVNAVSSSGDHEKGVEGDDPWGTKATPKKATESWGNEIGSGGDHGKGKDVADDPWGGKQILKEKTNSWGTAEDFGGDLKKPSDGWGNAVSSTDNIGKGKAVGGDSWGSAVVTPNTDGWGSKETNNKDNESCWATEASFSGDKKSSWDNTATKQDSDNFGKNAAAAAGTGWGAVVTQGVENNGQPSQEDSWSKATKSWKGNQSEPGGQPQNDSWGKPATEDTWGKPTTKDSWSNKNDNNGDGGSGWNQKKSHEACSTDDQQDGWNKPRNFDGGRGSGGRRGGHRGGNRDQSGRGRSFGRGGPSDDQSDGWKKNNSFGADQGSSWGNSSSDAGWKKNDSFDGLQGSGWGNSSSDAGGNKSSDWNKGKTSDANQTSGWGSGPSETGGSKSSSWGDGNNKSAGWNQGVSTEDRSNNWRGGKSFGGGRTSGWGAGSDGSGGESPNGSNRGRGFGRGPNRGGFSNRGHNNDNGESTEFANRGRGFNRGPSGGGRGSFGNRGRGRRDASAETDSSGWNKSDSWGNAAGSSGGAAWGDAAGSSAGAGTPKKNLDSWGGGTGWGDGAGSSAGAGTPKKNSDSWGGGAGWGNAAGSSGDAEKGDPWGSNETSKKTSEGWGTDKGGW